MVIWSNLCGVMTPAWAVFTAQVIPMTFGSVPSDFPSDFYEGFMKFFRCRNRSAGVRMHTYGAGDLVGCTRIQEAAVDDTVRASAPIGFGGLLLRCPGGAMRSVEQSPEVAVLCTSPDPGDRRFGAVVFEHLVD